MTSKKSWPETDSRLTKEDKEFIAQKIVPLFDGWEYARVYYGLRFAQDLIESFGIMQLDRLSEPSFFEK